jgi:hypothetical protein
LTTTTTTTATTSSSSSSISRLPTHRGVALVSTS